MNMAPVDTLPEFTRYRDEGCEVYPSCLECPSPHCLEEAPRAKQKAMTAARAGEMLALRERGLDSAAIARLFGVSLRTAQRALQQARRVSRPRTKGGRRSIWHECPPGGAR